MNGCAIYRRSDAWYFHGMSRTTAGVLLTSAPFRKDVIESEARLGEVCLEVLAACTEVVPHPSEFELQTLPLLKLAGVESWQEFMSKAPAVDVVRYDHDLEVTPTLNNALEEGYDAASSPPIRLPADANAAQLGKAISEAFRLCE